MSKIVSSMTAFIQTDYGGNVISPTPANSWFGNAYTDCRVNIAGNTLHCKPNQRIRVTPMEVSFDKGMLPVVNNQNNCFFVVDSTNPAALTITPVYIPVGNCSCVGNGNIPAAAQIPNSLCGMVNAGLVNAGFPAVTCRVNNQVLAPIGAAVDATSFVGNIVFDGLGATEEIYFIRDTNQTNTGSPQVAGNLTPYNRSAHRLLGGYLNEVHFAVTNLPSNAELAALEDSYAFEAGATIGMPYPPQLKPLNHIYLRSNTLGPNNLEIAVNSTNPSNGMASSNIILRVPYNCNTNTSLEVAGNGGQNFNPVTGTYANNDPPNVVSAYYTNTQWRWTNHSGKDFAFISPSNIVSTMQFSLTDTQGVNLIKYYVETGLPKYKSGYGMFLTIRFDILED